MSITSSPRSYRCHPSGIYIQKEMRSTQLHHKYLQTQLFCGSAESSSIQAKFTLFLFLLPPYIFNAMFQALLIGHLSKFAHQAS